MKRKPRKTGKAKRLKSVGCLVWSSFFIRIFSQKTAIKSILFGKDADKKKSRITPFMRIFRQKVEKPFQYIEEQFVMSREDHSQR